MSKSVKGKFKPKGFKKNNSKQGKENFHGFKMDKTASKNDPSWYNKNPLLTKIAGLVNFFTYRAGRPIDLKPVNDPYFKDTVVVDATHKVGTLRSLPVINTLFWIPTPGVNTRPSDPANKVANNSWIDLMVKNMANSMYDAIEVINYFLACDSIFAMYAYLCMIYTHAKRSSFMNTFYPKGILRALHVDANNIQDNLDKLLFKINIFRETINKLRVPKKLDYVARHLHLSTQIYKDADNAKAQLFAFVPLLLWKYDGANAKLVEMKIGSEANVLTYQDLIDKMESLLNSVIPDQTMCRIAADCEKYLTDSEFWKVDPLDWVSDKEPVYSEEMLWQIHNADFLEFESASGLEITQRVNSSGDYELVFDPEFTKYGCEFYTIRKLIDSRNEVPDNNEILESTRLKAIVKVTQRTHGKPAVTSGKYKIVSCGSEIIANAKAYYALDDDSIKEVTITNFVKLNSFTTGNYQGLMFIDNDFNSGFIGSSLYNLIDMSVVDYRPITHVVYASYSISDTAGNIECAVIGTVAPLTNYGVIDDDQLNGLHEQSLMSMFDYNGKMIG